MWQTQSVTYAAEPLKESWSVLLMPFYQHRKYYHWAIKIWCTAAELRSQWVGRWAVPECCWAPKNQVLSRQLLSPLSFSGFVKQHKKFFLQENQRIKYKNVKACRDLEEVWQAKCLCKLVYCVWGSGGRADAGTVKAQSSDNQLTNRCQHSLPREIKFR